MPETNPGEQIATPPDRVMVTMRTPYEQISDGQWMAEAETIDGETLADRQQAEREVAETWTRRKWTAALRWEAAQMREAADMTERSDLRQQADASRYSADCLEIDAHRIEAGELTPWADDAAARQMPDQQEHAPEPVGEATASSGNEPAAPVLPPVADRFHPDRGDLTRQVAGALRQAELRDAREHEDGLLAAVEPDGPPEWHVTVCVHEPLTEAQRDELFTAVADAAHEVDCRWDGPDVQITGAPCRCLAAEPSDDCRSDTDHGPICRRLAGPRCDVCPVRPGAPEPLELDDDEREAFLAALSATEPAAQPDPGTTASSDGQSFAEGDLVAIEARTDRALDWVRRGTDDGWLPLSVREHFEHDFPALVARVRQAEAELSEARRAVVGLSAGLEAARRVGAADALEWVTDRCEPDWGIRVSDLRRQAARVRSGTLTVPTTDTTEESDHA